MDRSTKKRRTNSLGGRRAEDSIFKPDKGESMASLALVGVLVVVIVATLLVIHS